MKKLLSIFTAACLLAACNSSSTTSTTDSSTTMSADTTSAMAPDTSSAAMAPDTTSSSMKDGVMTLKDGKMMVMQSGSWQPMTEDVTCTNGVKVSAKGEISKGSKKKTLTEGMMIDKDGQLTDANGKLVDNAGW